MLTSINSASLVSESRQAHQRKSESALQWTGIRPDTELFAKSGCNSVISRSGEVVLVFWIESTIENPHGWSARW